MLEYVCVSVPQLQFANEQSDASWISGSAKDLVFLVQVSCQAKMWMVRRSYEEFRTLDAHLHQCIYDRRYSQLLPLPPLSEIGDRVEIFTPLLSEYLSRLSMIVDNKLNCGPVLTWMEIDNRGNRFLLKEEASLNVPAIAAAHVIKRYTAQASDEISIEVWSCCRDTQNQMRFTLVAVIVFRFLCHLCLGLSLSVWLSPSFSFSFSSIFLFCLFLSSSPPTALHTAPLSVSGPQHPGMG
ncbi:unnamed protein product [Oncorhynchus mykiss]|uniref:PX domain-containing protein n=1 Tax=Oncorhynchus mykiss TaxID=8022 RepID=A0A060ZD72_ONCMY|nr:unnamed protein product [Oncorhynchus mykiss]